MDELGISWAGIRTNDFDATVNYFSKIVGLPMSLRDDEREVAQFTFESGELFEVFGPSNRYYELHSCPVFAFKVDDIESTRKEMDEKGVDFVTEIRTWEDYAWFYFRGPDDYLYEIVQNGTSSMEEVDS